MISPTIKIRDVLCIPFVIAFTTFYVSFAQAIIAAAAVVDVGGDASALSKEHTKVPLEAHVMYVLSP